MTLPGRIYIADQPDLTYAVGTIMTQTDSLNARLERIEVGRLEEWSHVPSIQAREAPGVLTRFSVDTDYGELHASYIIRSDFSGVVVFNRRWNDDHQHMENEGHYRSIIASIDEVGMFIQGPYDGKSFAQKSEAELIAAKKSLLELDFIPVLDIAHQVHSIASNYEMVYLQENLAYQDSEFWTNVGIGGGVLVLLLGIYLGCSIANGIRRMERHGF